jgi:Nickel responsive protein SCO4226-like
MQLYGILRRNGWASLEDLEIAGKRSAEVGDTPGSGVRWIRSYALSEESGEIGTFCVYEGESVEAIRKHAELRPPLRRGDRDRDHGRRPPRPGRRRQLTPQPPAGREPGPCIRFSSRRHGLPRLTW